MMDHLKIDPQWHYTLSIQIIVRDSYPPTYQTTLNLQQIH
jgi:hypothetical protein